MKLKPIKTLQNKAWKLCSEYIRRRDGGKCFTCGIQRDIKEMHAGHFRHGKTTPLYYNETNVHCQCPKCNTYLSGNRDIYLRNIQLKYGIEHGDWLIKESRKVHRYKRKELEDIIEYYTDALDKLSQE